MADSGSSSAGLGARDPSLLPASVVSLLPHEERCNLYSSRTRPSPGSASSCPNMTVKSRPDPPLPAQSAELKYLGNSHPLRYSPVEQVPARSTVSSISWSEDGEDSSYSESISDSISIVSQPSSEPQPQGIPSPTASLHSSGSDADSEPDSTPSDVEPGGRYQERAAGGRAAPRPRRVSSAVRAPDLTIEDVDPTDHRWRHLQVLLPTEVESSASRSRSETRQKEFERGVMSRMSNLNCDSDASKAGTSANTNTHTHTHEEREFLKRQRELRHMRRMSLSGAVSKRSRNDASDAEQGRYGLEEKHTGPPHARSHKRHCSSRIRGPHSQNLMVDASEGLDQLEARDDGLGDKYRGMEESMEMD